MSDASLTGEEPRRGQVAREMLDSGDWIVPRLQGHVFLSRPPMQNWAIALVGVVRGQVDAVAVRLPSGLAMIFVVVLVYGYCRRTLPQLGAFAAAASLATMGLVLQFGWIGETEAIYMLFVSASLLLWRWADASGKPLAAWGLGYGFAMLGMLTKGPQATVYFAGGVGVYLLLCRRWLDLFRWQHLVGLAVFFAGWATWQIPYFLRAGAENSWVLLNGDIAMRFQGIGGSWRLVEHLVTFPFDVLACMLPWSVLLLPYLQRDFRRTLGPAGEDVRFLACVAGVGFLSCWFVPGAINRYFAPIFPCIAPMIGLVVQRCLGEPDAGWANLWNRFLTVLGGVMLVACAWVLGVTLFDGRAELGSQSLAFALFYAVATVTLGVAAIVAARRQRLSAYHVGILSILGFLGLSWAGVVINTYAEVRNPIAQNVAELKERLPADVKLVSLGPVDAHFLFHYGQSVEWLPRQATGSPAIAEGAYFCMDSAPDRPKCDFPYEEIAAISYHEERLANPTRFAIVGRRLPAKVRQPIYTASRIDIESADSTRRW